MEPRSIDKERKPKFTSNLRLSCDSCHFRKTRCDRKIRLESGKNGCSFCSSMGLHCSITPTSTLKKNLPRLGKRLRVLLNVTEESKYKAIDRSFKSSPPDQTRNTPPTFKGKDGQLQNLSTVTPFLGVPGLTMAKLDECIEAFFLRLGPCMPLSEPSVIFWPRYRSFLDIACGTTLEAHGAIEPASELLVLAVACRGCGNTGLDDRSQLVSALSDQFVCLANERESHSLASLDGIEAVNLISERVVQPLYTGGSKNNPTPLRLDVLGRSSSIELALLSNLNIPARSDMSGIEHQDRSRFIFWTIFMHDAFRSVAARRMYRIHEEDIGWPIPDGVSRSRKFPDYGIAMYSLALIARGMSREILSTKAKRDGVSHSTLCDVVTKLNTWHEELDEPLKFKWNYDEAYSPFKNDVHNIELRSKRSFMLTIWLSLYLQVWASLPSPSSVENSREERHLESETVQAYFRMASLARYCHRYDLADCAPNELRNIPAAWALWYASYIRRTADTNVDITAERINELNQACHALVDCVRSARSFEDSGELAERLVAIIAQALSFAEERLRNCGEKTDSSMENLESHPDMILRAADEGMTAFKTSLEFRTNFEPGGRVKVDNDLSPHTLNESPAQGSYQMAFNDSGYTYQTEVSLSGQSSISPELSNVSSNTRNEPSNQLLGNADFLDVDMQNFLASCGIEASLYKIV